MAEAPIVHELLPAPSVPATLCQFRNWPFVVLFESAQQREVLGRYSFLSADPYRIWEQATVPFGSDPLCEIRSALLDQPAETVSGLPPFQGGAAGLLGYELSSAWERITHPPINELQFPALAFGLYDWVIAWDHSEKRAWVISQGMPEPLGVRRTTRAADRLEAVLRQLRSVERVAILTGEPHNEEKLNSANAEQFNAIDRNTAVVDLHGNPFALTELMPQLTSNFRKSDYLTAVGKAIDYIKAGDAFQINLSQRLAVPWQHNPLSFYLNLRRCNPAPFASYLQWNDWAIASSSPERFLQVRKGQVETRPIKGTRTRRDTPEADLFTRDELRESGKDTAENVMIVDLLRNDLSRVCEPGSIRVPELCRVETYETVQHLVSVVEGSLRSDKTCCDLLAATFPGGSITGAPKVRAMEIIAELEPTVRGPYCGSLVYLGYDGAMDSSILIRTVGLRHGWGVFPVGGGVIAPSIPEDEYSETLHKAAGMLRAFHADVR